jgi:hypothetical protein|tara:strand:+ start:117 stop:398 length:282 start_codon:yes stop_codon:yes gene_type:complete
VEVGVQWFNVPLSVEYSGRPNGPLPCLRRDVMAEKPEVSMEEFKLMADRAGLGMDQSELEHLKPIYELYMEYTAMVHSINFGSEEMVVEFHPD